MHQPPRHRADSIEEVEGSARLVVVDAAGSLQEAQCGRGLERRPVRDAPVMLAIPAASALAFGEVQRD
jgi:hypothetical protein